MNTFLAGAVIGGLIPIVCYGVYHWGFPHPSTLENGDRLALFVAIAICWFFGGCAAKIAEDL